MKFLKVITIFLLLTIIYQPINVLAHTFIGNKYKDTTKLVETFYGFALSPLIIYNEPNERAYKNRIKQEFGEQYISLSSTSWGVTKPNTNVIIINCESGCDYEYVLTHELVHRYQFLKGKEYCHQLDELEYKAEVIANIILNRKYSYNRKFINKLFISDAK